MATFYVRVKTERDEVAICSRKNFREFSESKNKANASLSLWLLFVMLYRHFLLMTPQSYKKRL